MYAEMALNYISTTSSSSSWLPLDSSPLSKMQAVNTSTLETLDQHLKSTEKTEGESEISDAREHGVESRINVVLTLVRIAFFWSDFDSINWGMGLMEGIALERE